MDWESEQSLRELRRLAGSFRRKLDELIHLVGTIDEIVHRLGSLHPELAITLVSESVLHSADGIMADRDVPEATLGIRLPGGIGLCVWTKNRLAPNGVDGGELHFVPLSQTPPVLIRLLAPHLESLLDSLRQRIES